MKVIGIYILSGNTKIEIPKNILKNKNLEFELVNTDVKSPNERSDGKRKNGSKLKLAQESIKKETFDN